MVNRVWSQFMSRGIVNPVDDMHDGNAPSHPQLLAELAAQFSANNFDVKYLIRSICNSEAYQRSSRPIASNKEASPTIYSRMAVKVMSGEQLIDSVTLVVGTQAAGGKGGKGGPGGGVKGLKAGFGKAGGGSRTAQAAFFGTDEGSDATEYQDGIPQVLRLMNGPALSRSPQLMNAVRGKTPDQAVEQIYLTALSRRPTKEEKDKLLAYVGKVGVTDAYGDILWAALNSSEFRMNR